MAPQRCLSIPRTCEHVTLQGERNLADVIKLKIFKWGDYLGMGFPDGS